MLLLSMVNKVHAQYAGFDDFDSNSKIKVNFVFTLIYVIFTILSGIRYDVGTDYNTYIMHQIPDALNHYVYSTGYKVEPLYRGLIYIGNFLGSAQWVFVFTHIIFMYFVLQYIKQQSRDYVFSIFIFVFSTFYSFSLNGMRQAIATSVFLFAIKYIYRRQYKRYFLFIIIAILFHKSAIIYIPFYFLNRINLTKKTHFFLITIISVILAFNSKYAYNFAYKFSLKYHFYTKFFNSRYSDGLQVNTMYISMLLLNLIILYLFYLFGKNQKDNDLATVVNYNIHLVSLMFSAIAFSIPGAFRVFYFFIPVQMVFVPNIIVEIKNDTIKLIVKLLLMLVYIFIFIRLIMISNQNGTLPYQTIFQMSHF